MSLFLGTHDRVRAGVIFACALATAACASPSEMPPGGALPSEVSDCKAACNQLKFFECNDALDHAACFASCDAASSSQIEVFANCVAVDICDADCAMNLQQAAPPVETPPPASDCASLCSSFITEGCVPGTTDPGVCPEVCAESGALVAYCLTDRTGCTLTDECSAQVGPPDPAEECRDACQQLGVFSCITAADVSTCSTACGTASESAIASFTACASAGICTDDTCFRGLTGGGASADVPGCRMACDQLAFFDCIDAATQSECRSVCAEASAEAVDTFKACTMGICDDGSCYDVLAASVD